VKIRRGQSKRLRETDVLTPAEFAALIPELELRGIVSATRSLRTFVPPESI